VGVIRAGRRKLIERFEDGSVELYDLAADPGLPGKPAAVGRFRAGETIRTDRHRFTEYSGPQGGAAGRGR
jgi:hypothetical protein